MLGFHGNFIEISLKKKVPLMKWIPWKNWRITFIGVLLSPTVLVPSFPQPHVCTVSDCSRVSYTPTPSPCSHVSPSLPLRFLGFYSSLRFLRVESMYTNSMYDAQPSVWGALTSSRFISLFFITPTPCHLLSLTLTFSVIINKHPSFISHTYTQVQSPLVIVYHNQPPASV